MSGTLPSDNLFIRIASGDKVAYELLFRKYYGPMVMYANRILNHKSESEDLVIDLFCTLWNKRAQLPLVKSEQSYIFTLLHNKVIDLLRSWQRVKKRKLTEEVVEEPVEETVFEVELYVLLNEAIEQLPKKCSEVLRLKMEGLDDREISEKLGIRYETVRSHTKRGIFLIRKKWGKIFSITFFI